MAGVNPVEYIKDSSTAGFAVAGEQKPITDNNANTIKKDVDQGNTAKLDNDQTKFLEGRVDVDTIDYSNEEMKNVGKNQIDTDDTEKTKGGEKAAALGGSVAASAGVLFAPSLVMPITGLFKSCSTSAQDLIVSGISLIAGGVALSTASSFDSVLSARNSAKDASGDTNQTIQNYFDLMNSDMDTMVEDAQKYKELSDTKLTGDVDRITQIGVLQGQIATFQSQGNFEKVAELQAQLDELTQEGEQDPTGAMLGELEKGLETYSGNSAEASGVAESGDVVADFLKQGTTMGVYGTINSAALLVGTIQTSIAAAKAIAHIKWPWDAPLAFLASAMYIAAAALFIAANTKMISKTKDEFQCADAGDKMQEYVNNLHSNVEQQAGFTESTGAEYITITTENAETTQKVKEGVDKANKNNPTQPAGSNPTTPTNGNGNGNGEKPEEPTAPEGAAA